MKPNRAALVLLIGEFLAGCNAPQTSQGAIKPSRCELTNIAEAGSDWEFSESVNAMDGTKTSIASLNGRLIIRCHGGSLRKDLLCKGGKIDAYVLTNDIVDDEFPSVRVRFDDGQPIRQTWSRSTDYKATFAPNPRQFVADLIKSKEFFIEYPPYQKMPETLQIHVKGLAESVDAFEMDSFLRGLTREAVVEACGPVSEERTTVRVALSYYATSTPNTGVKFEFSTYGDDVGKITSIGTVGGNQLKDPLTWYGSTIGIGDSYNQMKALRLINSSPGLSTLWQKSRQTAPTQKPR